MSPSTATRRPRRVRGEVVEGGAHRQRVGVVAVVDDDDPARPARRARRAARRSARRRARRLARRRARGRRGERVRRSALTAVDVRRSANGSRRAPSGERVDVAAGAEGDDVDVVAQVRRRAAARRPGRPRSPPARRPASSSALAARDASSEPSSSRWTGPMLVITPTSGSAIAASSAIWPKPRIAHLEHEHLGARRARRGPSAAARSRC